MRNLRALWVFRPLNAYENDWELITFAIGTFAGVLGFVWVGLDLFIPGCGFLALTGLPCLTCGGTRAVQAILSGDLVTAAGWNPGLTGGLLLLAGFYVYCIAVVCAGRKRVRILPGAIAGWTVRTGVVAIIVANWIYVARRLAP